MMVCTFDSTKCFTILISINYIHITFVQPTMHVLNANS